MWKKIVLISYSLLFESIKKYEWMNVASGKVSVGTPDKRVNCTISVGIFNEGRQLAMFMDVSLIMKH